MDDIVKQALAKWPHVPACYGWLGLDGRGNWYLRDDAAQAAGAFGSAHPAAKGSLLAHAGLIAFIERNYASDSAGCWFFQNGPQRVYVELQYTPWVWRIDAQTSVHSHTGQRGHVLGSYVDEAGCLYLHTDLGFGLVHTADMEYAAHAVESGHWLPQDVLRQDLPRQFGYDPSPAASYGGT